MKEEVASSINDSIIDPNILNVDLSNEEDILVNSSGKRGTEVEYIPTEEEEELIDALRDSKRNYG